MKTAKKVSRVTRDAVVGAAERLQELKKQTVGLAHTARRKWDESKPRRQMATNEVKKAAEQAVEFGRGVRTGVKEGFREIKKRSK